MSSRQNVLLVANYPPDVGYAWWLMENFWIQIDELVDELDGNCVLAYPAPGDLPEQIESSRIDPTVHDWDDRSPGNLLDLRELLRRRQIGTVYLTDRPYYDWLYALLRAWGVDNIVLHDHMPGERSSVPGWKMALKRAIHRLRIFSCHLYIGVSEFVRRRFVNVAGIPEARVTHVHNGVTVPEQASPAHDVRKATGADDRSVLVVSVGRAHRYKGIDFMIDTAREVLDRCERDVRFLHVGDGPHLEEFRERVKAERLEDRFHFAGHRDDVFSVLLASDIAFHASRGEAFSLAVLEYMAAGLPVVLPDHCANPEAVEHDTDGLLYMPHDLRHSTEHLLALVEDEERRRRLGDSARRKWASRFRLEHCNERFRRVMGPTLQAGSGR